MSQYTQTPYPQQPPSVPRMPRNGLGLAALVLGIVGVCAGLIPLLFWLAGVLGLLALVLGLLGRGRTKRGQADNRKTATTGVVLGLASLALSVVGVVITVTAVDDAMKEIDKAVDSTSVSEKSTKKGGSGHEDPAARSHRAGDTVAYESGIEVTVSGPSPYTASSFAAGHTAGNKPYKVTVRIENKGSERFDSALTTVEAHTGKDGRTAEQVFDEHTGTGFTGKLLPGRTATVDFVFDTPADTSGLAVQVTPGFDHDSAQWDLRL